MVALRAFAWKALARQPAARVRFAVMAARTSQAALAGKRPEGRWASGPSFQSAKTCSMMAWPRCCTSATRRQGVVGLADRHDPSRLEAACARAITAGDPSYRTIKGILAAGTDRDLPAAAAAGG
jgi:hypothetical protein